MGWPVPKTFEPALRSLQHNHRVNPFPLYDRAGHLAQDPTIIKNMLEGSLVEVYFRARHHVISEDVVSTGPLDFFQLEIQQVAILEQGLHPVPHPLPSTLMVQPVNLPASIQ